MFCKKGALNNFAKFLEKHLCQRLIFASFLTSLHRAYLATPFAERKMQIHEQIQRYRHRDADAGKGLGFIGL